MHGKVLITTRLRPTPLETRGDILLQGCREEELVQLEPTDAVDFFHAQGIRGGRAEIEAACEPYGYHPLSLRLLAGLIANDFQQPGDIVAAQHTDVSGNLVQRQHHVLEQAYASLGPARRKLLSRIACFRSPVNHEALKALARTESVRPKNAAGRRQRAQPQSEAALDADLHDLIARGLLHRDLRTKRFDLHPIVRRYAYEHLTASDRIGAHARLRDYFAAIPVPERVRSLDDLAPVIELYHHTVRAGQYDEALAILRSRLVPNPLHFQFGAYQLMIELKLALFPDGEDRPPSLRNEAGQSWVLSALAISYAVSGQPRRALPLFKASNDLSDKRGDQKNLATGLVSVAGVALMPMGGLRTAESCLGRL
jgi:hypothetical protein